MAWTYAIDAYIIPGDVDGQVPAELDNACLRWWVGVKATTGLVTHTHQGHDGCQVDYGPAT